MYGNPDERTLVVKKDRLVEALVRNREAHGAEFAEAKSGFWIMVEERLAKMLGQVKGGDHTVTLSIDLKPPQDHTDDYTLAIEAMEWEVNDTVEITFADFRRYVKNEWEWQHAHKHLHSFYNASNKG